MLLSLLLSLCTLEGTVSENTRLRSFEDDDLPHVTSLQQGPQVRPYYSSAPVTDVRAHAVPLHSVVGGYELQKQHEILNFSLLRTSVMLCHHHITPSLYEWRSLLRNPPNRSLFFNPSSRELNPFLKALSCFKAIVHKWRLWSNVKNADNILMERVRMQLYYHALVKGCENCEFVWTGS